MTEVWRELGLPGLVDVHTHFLPAPVQAKVWAYFDAAGANYGVDWPVHYRGTVPERLAQLRAQGVRAFTSLVYAHRPGMSAWLNDWAAQFAAATPNCLHSATFFPEPEAVGYVRAALDRGARVFKAHVQVGGYDPLDPLLDPVWGLLADARVPVVIHCGSGPMPGRHTGPGPVGAVLARHPELRLVIAHLGLPEYHEHLDLVARYPGVYADTTMVGTDFTERLAPMPADLGPRLAAHADRILLGSDFPSIPYPYAHQVDALVRLGLGDDWLRRVLWGNGADLFGISST
ncbi:amidohydrolase family protein [Longispora sp. NPDC051575]|uniref:amidohydrolase family protein n=1 Tax=Longispora sp. NPDC051575 TaxID=3154943 RepID=UPI00341BDC18